MNNTTLWFIFFVLFCRCGIIFIFSPQRRSQRRREISHVAQKTSIQKIIDNIYESKKQKATTNITKHTHADKKSFQSNGSFYIPDSWLVCWGEISLSHTSIDAQTHKQEYKCKFFSVFVSLFLYSINIVCTMNLKEDEEVEKKAKWTVNECGFIFDNSQTLL